MKSTCEGYTVHERKPQHFFLGKERTMKRSLLLRAVVMFISAVALAPQAGCGGRPDPKPPVTPVRRDSGEVVVTAQVDGRIIISLEGSTASVTNVGGQDRPTELTINGQALAVNWQTDCKRCDGSSRPAGYTALQLPTNRKFTIKVLEESGRHVKGIEAVNTGNGSRVSIAFDDLEPAGAALYSYRFRWITDAY